MNRCKFHYLFMASITSLLWLKCWCWKLDNRNLLYTNQDVVYECPLNSMCRCASPPNETRLLEINCNEVSLHKFPEFLQGTVKHIDMSRTYIQSVDDETFQGLRLESLKLVDNRLREFGEKCFNFMTHSLMLLDVSGNLFQSLPLDSLKNLHTLTRLIAQRNQIQHLDGNWGNLADSLRSLHLSSNTISEITHSGSSSSSSSGNNGDISTSGKVINSSLSIGGGNGGGSGAGLEYRTFAKLRKLVWLDLSGNRIAHISSNMIPKSLVTIDVSRNVLNTFPTNLLEHLHDLKMLVVRDNLITRLPVVSLGHDPVHLEKLDVGVNLLEELPAQTMFNGTLRARAVTFDRNYLRRVPANAFKGMGIVHMVLAFNYIEEIDDAAFSGLEQTLEYLDLERNLLTIVPHAITRLERLKYLYLTTNDIASVGEWMGVPTLRVLSLAGNNFTGIPPLLNCTELSYLNMGYNRVSDVGDDAFIDWGGKLHTLLLRNNKISHLGENAFNGLDEIKEISLSFNDIHYVHPMVFANVSKTLKILELSFGMYRDDFPLEPISYLTELMWLGLDNNNLKAIPEHSLHSLTQLTYVNLAFNRLATLPRSLFIADTHKNLIEVDLSYNQLEMIRGNTFDDLELLQIVTLTSNRLQTIEKFSFYNLQLLTYIDLSYNRIANISDMAFQFLPNILAIDLQFNQLTRFSFKSFMHITNKTTPMRLNISYNHISQIDGDLNSYFYIYSLDASHNQLTDTLSFKNIGYSLRVLYLNSNNFTLLNNNGFGDLTYLEILNLSNNSIHSLRKRCFSGLPNLQELDLSGNRIDLLQIEQFSNLHKLRTLRLAYNRLRTIPRDAFLNTRIEFLDLSNNNIQFYPQPALAEIGFTLRSINVHSNQIDHLDATMFTNTQYILELNLSSNQIKMLPDSTFSPLQNLTDLDLSDNSIMTSNFKELFFNIPRLRTLKLRKIGMYKLPPLRLAVLRLLDISSNNLMDISDIECPQLVHLHIGENRINNLANVTRHLGATLRYLDVSQNPIRKQSMHDFTAIRRLEELNYEHIKISSGTTDIFTKLHNLRRLRISSQQNFSDIVSKLRSLQQLIVHIYEDTLRNDFFGRLIALTKLQLVDVTGPRLAVLEPNVFDGFARTRDLKIRLTRTQVVDLPPGLFFSLKMVPRLSIDLSNNKLAALSPDSFYPNASSWDAVGTRSVFGGMDIAGNPLQCECGLVWLGHWLRRWLRETAQVNLMNKEELKHMLVITIFSIVIIIILANNTIRRRPKL